MDLVGSDLLRHDPEAIRTLPEDCALPSRLIDHDVRGLIRAVAAQLDVGDVDPRALKRLHQDPSPLVVSYAAYVLGPEPELDAGHHGAGNLPARGQDLPDEGSLATVRRKVWDQQEGVGSVEPHADNIKCLLHGQSFWPLAAWPDENNAAATRMILREKRPANSLRTAPEQTRLIPET